MKFKMPLRFESDYERLALSETGPVSGATDDDLATINRMPMVLRPLTAADVFVRGMSAINTRPIKSLGLVLSQRAVQDIARLSPGSPVMANHDTGWLVGRTALPIGRTFAARSYAKGEGDEWCDMKFWADRSEIATAEKIDTGVLAEVSVSFSTDEPIMCTLCGKEMFGDTECPHMPGEDYEGKTAWGRVMNADEYFETSLCWKGAAEGTRLFIAAGATNVGDIPALIEAKRAKAHPLSALFERARASAPQGLSHLFEKQGG